MSLKTHTWGLQKWIQKNPQVMPKRKSVSQKGAGRNLIITRKQGLSFGIFLSRYLQSQKLRIEFIPQLSHFLHMFQQATEEAVKNWFLRYGEVEDVKLLKKPDGTLVGCAFVQYKTVPCAARGIKECNAKPFLGITLLSITSNLTYCNSYLNIYLQVDQLLQIGPFPNNSILLRQLQTIPLKKIPQIKTHHQIFQKTKLKLTLRQKKLEQQILTGQKMKLMKMEEV